ncbi:MAG: YraN family protein [Muribaculaceae bacterium]|nr:YraN family protein [Muribaculaceae bacterium]
MAEHNIIGARGERIAREYLIKQGYTIVDTNVSIGNYEIDFIAMHGSRILFVEVKTRSNPMADPIEAIDEKKIKRLCRAADTYIRAYDIPHEPQFDVITILIPEGNGAPEIEHYPDAFRPPLSGAW